MCLRRLLRGLLLVLFLLGALSCGNDKDRKSVYPVRGQVLFQGKPAAGALVLFHPVNDADSQTERPHGQVDQDGVFVLSTYGARDGAPAGDYVVTIDWRQVIPGHGQKGPSVLPANYGTPKQSPLRATVKRESNDLAPFQIAH